MKCIKYIALACVVSMLKVHSADADSDRLADLKAMREREARILAEMQEERKSAPKHEALPYVAPVVVAAPIVRQIPATLTETKVAIQNPSKIKLDPIVFDNCVKLMESAVVKYQDTGMRSDGKEFLDQVNRDAPGLIQAMNATLKFEELQDRGGASNEERQTTWAATSARIENMPDLVNRLRVDFVMTGKPLGLYPYLKKLMRGVNLVVGN